MDDGDGESLDENECYGGLESRSKVGTEGVQGGWMNMFWLVGWLTEDLEATFPQERFCRRENRRFS